MSTDIDWQHELDASFGGGTDVPPGHYVAAGQRAVRRRRRAALVAGLASAAVVAGVVWGMAPGQGPARSDLPVATDPDGSSAVPDGALAWAEGDPPARFAGDGAEIREGAVVNERRDDLYPGKATDSVALDVSFDGERWWLAMEWDGNEAVTTVDRPGGKVFEDFDAFVRDRVRGGGMIIRPSREDDDIFGGLVRWDGGEVRAEDGVVVTRVVADPVSSADDSVGLVLRQGDEVTWMLITRSPSSSGASYAQGSDSGWATFDQWLADQVALAEGDQAPQPVRLGDDGRVSPALPGVVVLDQQADPHLEAYGARADGVASAVALLEWKGQRWFVLVIDDSVTTVAADKAEGAGTLDEFVAFMADRADEGGMR